MVDCLVYANYLLRIHIIRERISQRQGMMRNYCNIPQTIDVGDNINSVQLDNANVLPT